MPAPNGPYTPDLFAHHTPEPSALPIGAQAWVLRGFALPWVDQLLPALQAIQAVSPFRHMVTVRGFTLSVALTNCGSLGWTSDHRGYRYSPLDPLREAPWPAMPHAFSELATAAALAAGFADFAADACLINHYLPGSRLSLHQDRNERSFEHPIVSVSLGLPAVFQFGGFERSDKALRIPLLHGDVAVWGGADRLRYHGVLPLKAGEHPLLGARRINLTMRKAG